MAIEAHSDIKSAKRTKQMRQKQATKTQDPSAPHVKMINNVAPTGRTLDSDMRKTMIAETAYEYAARRGFTPGYELDDWLVAEREIDARLYGETHPF